MNTYIDSFPRSPPQYVFATDQLQLAIYLHAAQRMPFLRCELTSTGKVRFVFEDLDNSGPLAELEYERRAEVAASALFASQKFLRRKMTEALTENRTTGALNGNPDRPRTK
jgi:hypothetical protein